MISSLMTLKLYSTTEKASMITVSVGNFNPILKYSALKYVSMQTALN